MAAAAILLAASCRICDPARSSAFAVLMDGVPYYRDDIEDACDLTASRCIRCHSIDRVLVTRPERIGQWEHYVERMRRMRGSGISRTDQQVIVRCLVYRSFGTEGLSELEASETGELR
jgi:hypothetical protein